MNMDAILRRLEVLEQNVSAIDTRLAALETSCAQGQEIQTTVLSAIASAHAAIRNAIRLTGGAKRGAEP